MRDIGITRIRSQYEESARMLKGAHVSQIVGHIHRREYAARTIYGPHGRRTIFAASPGTLCRVDGVVRLPTHRSRCAQVQVTDAAYDVAYDVGYTETDVPRRHVRPRQLHGQVVNPDRRPCTADHALPDRRCE